jgi:hypothetical protein
LTAAIEALALLLHLDNQLSLAGCYLVRVHDTHALRHAFLEPLGGIEPAPEDHTRGARLQTLVDASAAAMVVTVVLAAHTVV